MRSTFRTTGFSPRNDQPLGQERRTVAIAALLATLGLALCTLIAGTVVSMGVARAADSAASLIDQDGSLFVIALMLGLVFVALGGLSLMPFSRERDWR